MTENNTPTTETFIHHMNWRTWFKCVALAYFLTLPMPFLIATAILVAQGAPVPINILTLHYFVAAAIFVVVAWIVVGLKDRTKRSFLLTYGLTVLALGLAVRVGSMALFAPQFLSDPGALAFGLSVALLDAVTFSLAAFFAAGIVLRFFAKRYLVF